MIIRRTALGALMGTSLAAPFLLRPAGAQPAQGGPTPPAGAAPAPGTTRQTPQAGAQPAQQPGAAPARTADAGQLRSRALMGGAFALQTSELAERQGENRAVKQFAELEVAEQRALMEAMRLAGIDVPSAPQLDQRHAQQLEQLRGQRGAAFDRAYIEGQMTGHRELLEIHQQIARGGSREERPISTVAVPGIQTHLVMLQGIQGQMRG